MRMPEVVLVAKLAERLNQSEFAKAYEGSLEFANSNPVRPMDKDETCIFHLGFMEGWYAARSKIVEDYAK